MSQLSLENGKIQSELYYHQRKNYLQDIKYSSSDQFKDKFKKQCNSYGSPHFPYKQLIKHIDIKPEEEEKLENNEKVNQNKIESQDRVLNNNILFNDSKCLQYPKYTPIQYYDELKTTKPISSLKNNTKYEDPVVSQNNIYCCNINSKVYDNFNLNKAKTGYIKKTTECSTILTNYKNEENRFITFFTSFSPIDTRVNDVSTRFTSKHFTKVLEAINFDLINSFLPTIILFLEYKNSSSFNDRNMYFDKCVCKGDDGHNYIETLEENIMKYFNIFLSNNNIDKYIQNFLKVNFNLHYNKDFNKFKANTIRILIYFTCCLKYPNIPIFKKILIECINQYILQSDLKNNNNSITKIASFLPYDSNTNHIVSLSKFVLDKGASYFKNDSTNEIIKEDTQKLIDLFLLRCNQLYDITNGIFFQKCSTIRDTLIVGLHKLDCKLSSNLMIQLRHMLYKFQDFKEENNKIFKMVFSYFYVRCTKYEIKQIDHWKTQIINSIKKLNIEDTDKLYLDTYFNDIFYSFQNNSLEIKIKY